MQAIARLVEPGFSFGVGVNYFIMQSELDLGSFLDEFIREFDCDCKSIIQIYFESHVLITEIITSDCRRC